MSTKFTELTKEEIIAQYHGGQSASALCAQYNIPRSTLYHWLQQNQPLKTSTDAVVYHSDYIKLKRHAEKLEAQLEVIKAAGCGTNAPLQEKLEALEQLHGQYSVYTLCEALDVARGTFYNHIFRRKEVTMNDKRRDEMREHIRNVFDESKQRYGARKISAVLRERGITMSERYIAGTMREMNLVCTGKTAKKDYLKLMGLTPKRQNLLQRQFNVETPNHVWVSDITCFKFKEQYYYICVIIDLFSRKIVAHKTSLKNSTYLVTSSFRQAFSDRGKPKELIFHSDRGCQYTAGAFQKLLKMNNVVQSFSKSGSPHDNAVAEAFFANMKKEELYRTNYKSERELCKAIDDYIVFYNTERPHGTLNYKTPNQFEELRLAE